MTSWACTLSLSTTMAPTPSPTLGHSSNLLSGRHHQLRRQLLGSSPQSSGHSLTFQTGQLAPRTLDPASQPSLMPEGPSPPPFESTPSRSVVFAEPSITVKDNQPQGSSQPEDIPGNVVVAVVVMVLILGGLVGLVIGGEILRRGAKTTGRHVSRAPQRCAGRRKSVPIKSETMSSQQSAKMEHEKFPYDEKTLTPLTRPPPILNRERKRRLFDVWPIRGLSRVLFSRRLGPDQSARNRQHPAPVAIPQTTWSEFSPVLLYAAPPRTVLAGIPEEHDEDVQGETGVGSLQRLLEPNPVVSTPRMKQVESAHNPRLKGSHFLMTTERPQGRRDSCTAGAKDEDTKSLGSSAPDMTADGGESSRSSIVSLESLDDGRESVKEEVFELKRAQTRSMQMNKGVLLSLSLNIPPDRATAHCGELGCGTSRPPSIVQIKERELSLAVLGGSLSAVNLDEFPSPPSMLPVIPSFVSGFL